MEINAGQYYLRQLRCDDRLDDRPALVAEFTDEQLRQGAPGPHIGDIRDIRDAAGYIAGRAADWTQDRGCWWAICEPTSGDLLGEVGLSHLDLDAGTAEATCWVVAQWRGRGAAGAALGAALRFGYGALGLRRVDYVHAEGNIPAQRVAEKCGFSQLRSSGGVIVWRRNADG